jgi:hypothetical protein
MLASADVRTPMTRFSSSRALLYSAPPTPEAETEATDDERADVESPDSAAADD